MLWANVGPPGSGRLRSPRAFDAWAAHSSGVPKPLVNLRPEWGGAVFGLERNVVVPGHVTMGPWEANLVRGLRCLVIERIWPPGEAPNLPLVREKAEKALDLLATMGGGAYRIADWSVAWFPVTDGLDLQVHGRYETPFPLGMTVLSTTRPTTTSGEPGDPKWVTAFRYFRLAQSSRDPYTAFRDTFLAVENALSAMFPRQLEPRRETELAWLKRALAAFDAKRPIHDGKSWLAGLQLDGFAESVYRLVRHPIFHAKSNEPHFVPFEPESDAKVRTALLPLTKLFLELAADFLKWPLNSRPQLQRDLATGAFFPSGLTILPFRDEPPESGKIKRIVFRLGPTQDLGGSRFIATFPKESLPEIQAIDGWVAETADAIIGTETFPVRIPLEVVAKMTITVQSGIAGDRSPLIRTEF